MKRLKEELLNLRSKHKAFQKCLAKSGDPVGVFVYCKKSAVKYVNGEYQNMRRLVSVFDIEIEYISFE